MKTKEQVADLLDLHTLRMAQAEARGERANRKGDREEDLAAEHDWRDSKSASEMLRWVLGMETDVNYKHLFPKP